MQTKALTPESYVFRFGKYKNMRAADVAELYEVDKNGDDKPVGLLYLQFLVEKCDWFRHKDIIEQIIKGAVDCCSGDDGKEPETPKPVEAKQKKEKTIKKEKSEKAIPRDTPSTTTINLS